MTLLILAGAQLMKAIGVEELLDTTGSLISINTNKIVKSEALWRSVFRSGFNKSTCQVENKLRER